MPRLSPAQPNSPAREPFPTDAGQAGGFFLCQFGDQLSLVEL